MRGASLVEKMIVLTLSALFTLSAAMASTNVKGDGESSPDNLLTAKQPAKFKHFAISDGLAANQTYNVLQSEQGFIWIATRQGLSKFDGTAFTNYTHDPDNPNSIASNYIWTMREAPNGTLWLSLWGGGLDRFDPVTEAFTHYRTEKDNPNSLSTDFILASFQDSRGNIWVATDESLEKLDPQTNTSTHYQPDPKNPNSLSAPVNKIQEDAHGQLWLGTYTGLDKFDPDSETFTHFHHKEGNPNSLSGGYVWSLFIDDAGIIWVGTDGGGLNRFDPTTETFTYYQHREDDPASLSNNLVTFLGKDQQGGFWVGTLGGGLNKFDPQTGRFTTFQYDKADPNSLSNNTVWSVIEDEAGAYWIATESGLNYYDTRGHRFDLYRTNPMNPNSLSSSFVMSFYEDESGVLWIGTVGGGLNKFDRRQGVFAHYLNDPANPASLGHNDVNRIAPGRNGILWLGTSGGLERFDPASETFVHYRHDPANPNSLLTNNIQGLIRDAGGKLWLASFNGGISHFDPNTETFTHFSHDDNDPNSLIANTAYDFLEASDGGVWVATQGGLCRLDPHTKKFNNFTLRENHLSDAVVEDVYEDSRGVIWVSTDNGLNKFNPATQTFTNYFTKNGLPDNHVSGLIEDNQGYLWIATYRGIARFDPQAEIFRTYDVRDGLQDNQFSQAIYKSKSGELFMGGVNGFNAFYPDNLTDNPYIPRVVLTDFQLLNRPVKIGGDSPLQRHINVTDHLTLPYNYSVLTLKFAALNYRAPEKNRFAYMLEGFDQDWMYTDSANRLATYTNLDPGDYTFRVKASNNDGVWNEEGTALAVTITPPWWVTWWFRSLAVLAAVGLAAAGYGYRVRNLRRRTVELERQVTARTQELAESNQQIQTAKEKAECANRAKSIFLANMSHELRTPLNAVLGFSQLMHNDRHATEDQKRYLAIIGRSGEHLLSLINNVLEISKIESGRVELEMTHLDLFQLIHEMKSLMWMRAHEKGLDFTLEQAPDLPRHIRVDGGKLRQVLINLIGNAIKHAASGTVILRAMAVEQERSDPVRVRFEVEDTGPGIRKEERERIFSPFVQLEDRASTEAGTGLGLAISRQYVELMGGKLGVTGEPGKGSIFHIEIPATVLAPEAIPAELPSGRRVIGLAEGQPRHRLLIVEVHPESRLLLRRLLEPLGFELREATNGEEAVAIFEQWRPDLIWMDIRMPVMDGLEATRRIKATDAGSRTRIVAVTAHALEEERREILAAGCDDFIRKPYRDGDIHDALTRHLGLRFVYEEEQSPDNGELPLAAADLADLPAELLQELEQALVRIDMDAVTHVIEAIHARHPSQAKVLGAVAGDLQFGRLLRIIRATRGETGLETRHE